MVTYRPRRKRISGGECASVAVSVRCRRGGMARESARPSLDFREDGYGDCARWLWYGLRNSYSGYDVKYEALPLGWLQLTLR